MAIRIGNCTNLNQETNPLWTAAYHAKMGKSSTRIHAYKIEDVIVFKNPLRLPLINNRSPRTIEDPSVIALLSRGKSLKNKKWIQFFY